MYIYIFIKYICKKDLLIKLHKNSDQLAKTKRKKLLRDNFPHSYSYSDEFCAQMNLI